MWIVSTEGGQYRGGREKCLRSVGTECWPLEHRNAGSARTSSWTMARSRSLLSEEVERCLCSASAAGAASPEKHNVCSSGQRFRTALQEGANAEGRGRVLRRRQHANAAAAPNNADRRCIPPGNKTIMPSSEMPSPLCRTDTRSSLSP